MAKADSIQAEIGEMLLKGADRAKTMATIGKKWQLPQRTFDRHWKKANDKAREAQRTIDAVLTGTMQAEAVEALKNGLKSDLELELILSQIASGGSKVQEWVKGEAVLRDVTPTEICKAIDILYKKRGSNAPAKIAKTNVAGEDVESFEITLKL